ncbi:hypothetical protein K461DRAFT_270131 [Myriangium duriaei CBS 260.36]|uniref:PH domain-containing protein n=1 Tax=Myriangium duriaei CBS 260.36 TaxID=1168546 RepID=A0A9P4J1J6_9PEZI|nr:hypothetical protein K461DRAFT_270131 [Myriangium duriaei CBS 260.36]
MTDSLQPLAAPPTISTDDPFVSTPPHAHPPQPLRHGAFDPDAFTLHSNASPKQARLALEAHLKETDRRIQDASKLGTTLVHQRKELSARLKELKEHKDSDEIGPDLRKKLADLEREYTDVGRETARAVLPRSRLASNEHPDFPQSPAVFSGVSGASPSKVAAPSRKQRNQQANRVHDIEFATEISTSLLAQVRSLQAALVEKDDALKSETFERTHLEEEYTALRARLRHLDDNEQKYKDENWNLETQLQDLTAAMKAAADREQRSTQSLKTTQTEREAILRELEELKQMHGRLTDDTAANKRAHESELHLLRRDLAGQEHERDQLQRKIDELTSQNTELARAISYRMNAEGRGLDNHLGSGDDELTTDREFSEASPPPSPTKRGAAGGILETETLRSSIQHAHRMIQTLKNNIHREKTEKLELKRMLQDARDELESKRGDNRMSALKKRRSELESAKNRKARAEHLGSNRASREEIINDPEWEDDDGQELTRTSTTLRPRKLSIPGAYLMSEESTDAFETANEKDTSTETEAFQTTNEAFDSEDSGQATETEGVVPKAGKRYSSMPASLVANKRASYMSTASTSASEDSDDISTPVSAQPRYKVKSLKSRTSFRESLVSGNNSPAVSATFRNSPAYSHISSNRSTPIGNRQNLGDELEGLSDEDSIMSGTPSRVASLASVASTPGDIKLHAPEQSFAAEPEKPRSAMVDSGMMTEPWEPERTDKESKGVVAAAAGAIGGLVTGAFLGNHHESENANEEREVLAETPTTPKRPVFDHSISRITSNHTEPVEPTVPEHSYATVMSQNTEPIEPPQQAPLPLPSHDYTTVMSQHTEPVEPLQPVPAPIPSHNYATVMSQHTEPIEPPLPAPTPSPSHNYATVMSQHTEPVAPSRPIPAPVPSHSYTSVRSLHTAPIEPPQIPIPAHNYAAVMSQHTEPVEAPQPRPAPVPFHSYTDLLSQHTEPVEAPQPLPIPIPAHNYANISSQHTEPVEIPQPAPAPFPTHGFTTVMSQHTQPVEPAQQPFVPHDYATVMSQNTEPLATPEPEFVDGSQYFAISPIKSQNFEPWSPDRNSMVFPQRTSSKRVGSGIHTGTDAAVIAGGVMADKSFGDHEHPQGQHSEINNRAPFAEISNNAASNQRPGSATSGRYNKTHMLTSDEGTQTMMSSHEMDSIMKNRNVAVNGAGVAFVVPGSGSRNLTNTSSPRRSSEPNVRTDGATVRRPGSAGSVRSKNGTPPPPLPMDHSEKIALAASKAPLGSMGPPLMPASAYRTNQRAPSVQSRTSVNTVQKAGSLKTAPMAGSVRSEMRSPISRRSSVSSFASEVDHRLNPNGAFAYPADLPISTDPRMIAAITQTMIGEYLWKYTRSPLSSTALSSNRHRRFFWVHPYTRTLYWSESDPSTAGKSQLKAKSVAIEAVRVVSDDNAYPPGLHHKSLVVVTPAREIVFTAPTSQRHETWFNALSYLLLRTSAPTADNNTVAAVAVAAAGHDELNDEELAEFNPQFASRSSTRHTARQSNVSVGGSSYASRSQHSYYGEQPTLTPRNARAHGHPVNAYDQGTMQSPRSPSVRSPSVTGRISNMFTSRGRSGSRRSRASTVGAKQSEADEADEARRMIEEQEMRDRMENVRACCDGKHDVGSLSKRGESFRGRSGQGHASVASRV